MASPELWDLYDELGRATGGVVRRDGGALPPGRFHLVVATCVVRGDGLLLMTRRAPTKSFPSTWELPGGSALAGESARDAAVRELHEETGLTVGVADLRPAGRHVEATALVELFAVAVPGCPQLSLQPAEVDDAEWVTVEEAGRRRATGQMASVWTGRLSTVWPELVAAVAAI